MSTPTFDSILDAMDKLKEMENRVPHQIQVSSRLMDTLKEELGSRLDFINATYGKVVMLNGVVIRENAALPDDMAIDLDELKRQLDQSGLYHLY